MKDAPRTLPSHRRRSRRPMPFWLRAALRLVQIVIVACTIQLSGGSHVLASVIHGDGVACIDVPEHPGDDDHQCPPGCPDCACPHGRLPSLPPSFEPALAQWLDWVPEPGTPYRAGVPPSPPPSAPDRPPRS